MEQMRKVAPSLVSADLSHLARVLTELELAGADRLHLDVEDDVFVHLSTRLVTGSCPPIIRQQRGEVRLEHPRSHSSRVDSAPAGSG